MDIRGILEKASDEPVVSFKKINGGFDSSVWKVETDSQKKLAIRIVTRDRNADFLIERDIIEFAAQHHIPVPTARGVKMVDEYSIMVSDWVRGRPLIEELMGNPAQAFSLGEEFGKVQARIHCLETDTLIQIPGNWLNPVTKDEKAVFEKLHALSSEGTSALLHLDYHPLNVMGDNGEITAVLDWINAGIGDPRLDIARTYSILQFEQMRVSSPFEELKPPILEFEKGWLKGYTYVSGELGDMELFYKWAGLRHMRDLGKRLSEEDRATLREWTVAWC